MAIAYYLGNNIPSFRSQFLWAGTPIDPAEFDIAALTAAGAELYSAADPNVVAAGSAALAARIRGRNAEEVQGVFQAAIAGAVEGSSPVPATRQVSAGTGLTGGGNLGADVTLAIDPAVTATKAFVAASVSRDTTADSGTVSIGAQTAQLVSLVLTGTPASDANLTTTGQFEGQQAEISNNTGVAKVFRQFNGLWCPPGNTRAIYSGGAWRYAAGSGGAFDIHVTKTYTGTVAGDAIWKIPANWKIRSAGSRVAANTSDASAMTFDQDGTGDVVGSFSPGAANTDHEVTGLAVDKTADRTVAVSLTQSSGSLTVHLRLLVQDCT